MIEIHLRGQHVGTLTDAEFDMWYFDGVWSAVGDHPDLEAKIRALDPREFMRAPSLDDYPEVEWCEAGSGERMKARVGGFVGGDRLLLRMTRTD